MIALLILLAALQIGDWLSTRAILAYPTGRENNLLIRWLMGRVGIDLALALKTVLVIVIGFGLTYLPWPLLAALCAFYAWIVWSNWRVLGRLKAKVGN